MRIGRNLGRKEEANGNKEWRKDSLGGRKYIYIYIYLRISCARDSASCFVCISSFNSQDNTMKCHCYKIRFIGEETGSRVLRGLGHLTCRVIHLGYDVVGIRTQLIMTLNPVL